jgi:hypothetical protein
MRARAPLVIYGGMALIALVCVGAVLIYDCRREAPYLDPEGVRPGDPPPPSLEPPPGRPRPPRGSDG